MKYLSEDKLTGDVSWLSSTDGCKKINLSGLVAIKNNLINAYLAYDTLITNYNSRLPNGIFHKDDKGEANPEKDLMIDFYERPPIKLSEVMSKRRKNHGLNECPYCGNPKSPDTLDHFIPKGNWSEYSIYPDNLVPQCRECAPIKGEKYHKNGQDIAIYIHPIFSDIISRVGFKINTTIDKGFFQYDVTCLRPIDMTEQDFQRVLRHMAGLNVKNRIIRFCHRTTAHWSRLQKNNINDVRVSFCARINEHGPISHDNWEIALYKSYISEQGVIDYFNSLCSSSLNAQNTVSEMVVTEFQ
ncbi:TPA: HNH endonuclease [Yersinia enterocolitica]|nr:HNH endonuclease [Yersinia enterocolitica]